jgi:hypothetical protein
MSAPDQPAEDEVTFSQLSDEQLVELLKAIELELHGRGWRPYRIWQQVESGAGPPA